MQLSVSVESVGNIRRKLTVEIPSDAFKDAYEKEVSELSRKPGNIRVSGFRPGKPIPVSVIKMQYGTEIKNQVISDLLKKSIEQVITEKALKPVSYPEFETINAKEGEALSYVAYVEEFPQFELKTLAGQTLEIATAEVNDAEVDKVIERLRLQKRTFEIVENRKAEKGDRVQAGLEIIVDGNAVENTKDAEFIVGDTEYFVGINAALEGKKAGEVTSFTTTLPERFYKPELAKKEAEIKLTLQTVSKANLPELDDAFAESLGIKAEGMSALKKEVAENLSRSLKEALQARFKNTIFQKWAELNEFDVPSAFLREEIENKKKQFAQRIGLPETNVSKIPDEMFVKEATFAVKAGILIGQWVEKNNFKVDDSLIDAKLAEMVKVYEDSETMLESFKSNKDMLAKIRAIVTEEQVAEKLAEEMTITKKPLSFDELMASHHAQ